MQKALDTIDDLSLGGGGGAITQATETALGGVRGATALQAIAISGTAILGWTVNRIRQLVAAALPTMTQTDIDDATTTRKVVTGELIAANAGSGSGGSAGGDRVVLADAVGVSNAAGPHEIALTEAMVARQLLSFFVFSSAAASPDGIGYLLSDDILALTPEATTPTDAENALPVVTASYSASNFSQQSGNYFVYRKDDETLWIRPTRLAAHSLTITATPLGGGGLTSTQQASGGLTRTSIFTTGDPFDLHTTDTDTALSAGNENQFIFSAVPKDDVRYIVVIIRVADTFDVTFHMTRESIDLVGPSSGRPNTIINTNPINGWYVSGRTLISADSREPMLINPTYAYTDFRRQASRYGIFLWLDDDSSGNNWRSIFTYCNSDVEMQLVHAGVYHV